MPWLPGGKLAKRKGPVMSTKTLRVWRSAACQTILSRANFKSLYLASSTI